MNVDFEAWLDREQPTEIATPIYQYTATTVTFTVLTAARVAVDITGYAAKFAAKAIDTESELFDVSCTISDPTNGKCTAALTSANSASAKECLAELRLWSSGNTADTVTHRIQFRFNIVEAIVQGA